MGVCVLRVRRWALRLRAGVDGEADVVRDVVLADVHHALLRTRNGIDTP